MNQKQRGKFAMNLISQMTDWRGATFLLLALMYGESHALPVLPFPSADDLTGPTFVEPFAGLPIVSESAGVGRTAPFFSDLPDGSLPDNHVVNILGNFLAFDSTGTPTSFDVVGVEVTVGSSTFAPAFGELNFAGLSSITFVDSLIPFKQVTYSASDFTLAFVFTADPTLAYSYELLVTGVGVGDLMTFGDAETGVPEPATLLLLMAGIAGMIPTGVAKS